MAQTNLQKAVEGILVWKNANTSRLVRTIKGEFIWNHRRYDYEAFEHVCEQLRKEYTVRECVLETDKFLKKIIEDKNAQ